MSATTVPSMTVPMTAMSYATTAPTVTTVPTATTALKTTLPSPGPAGDTANGRTGRARWDELTEQVREVGQYATRAEAERVTRIVLSALGGHVVGDERVDLARALPEEAARVIAGQIPATRPQTAQEFVDSVAARVEGATSATARWDVSSVLSVLSELAGADLTARLLARLPAGYALLFGRAELAPAP